MITALIFATGCIGSGLTFIQFKDPSDVKREQAIFTTGVVLTTIGATIYIFCPLL